MASGFFALLDDIATLMDDVAVMSKVAAKKTAGILGDDLAVNAEKASGFASSRELPVLWGYRPESELFATGAKYILNHPLDLIQILE